MDAEADIPFLDLSRRHTYARLPDARFLFLINVNFIQFGGLFVIFMCTVVWVGAVTLHHASSLLRFNYFIFPLVLINGNFIQFGALLYLPVSWLLLAV